MNREDILNKSRKENLWGDELDHEIHRQNERKTHRIEGAVLLVILLTNWILDGPQQITQIFWIIFCCNNASINMLNGYTDKKPWVFVFGALFVLPCIVCFYRFVTGLL